MEGIVFDASINTEDSLSFLLCITKHRGCLYLAKFSSGYRNYYILMDEERDLEAMLNSLDSYKKTKQIRLKVLRGDQYI